MNISVSRTLAVCFLAITTLTSASCTYDITFGDEETRLAHVVLVWLKEPGNSAHRTQLVRASERLEEIDGVIRVKTGQSIPSDRAVVDDSFDVGIYIELESVEALKAYATDPAHLAILRNDIAPVTERYIVYDFEIDRDN